MLAKGTPALIKSSMEEVWWTGRNRFLCPDALFHGLLGSMSSGEGYLKRTWPIYTLSRKKRQRLKYTSARLST